MSLAIELVPLDLIDPPAAPHRLAMDPQALEELASSIRLEGLKNPISLRPLDDGRYEIIAGHRRYTACQMCRHDPIEAMIREGDEASAIVERFTENMQREALSPMEEALALVNFMDESGLDAPTLAKRLGKTDHWIRTRISLMALPDSLKSEVHAGKLAIASALALGRVTDEQHRDYLMRYAIEGGASATVIKQWVDAWHAHERDGTETPPPAPTWTPGDAVVIIQIPCAVCGVPHDHREMAILRTCNPCLAAINEARACEHANADSS